MIRQSGLLAISVSWAPSQCQHWVTCGKSHQASHLPAWTDTETADTTCKCLQSIPSGWLLSRLPSPMPQSFFQIELLHFGAAGACHNAHSHSVITLCVTPCGYIVSIHCVVILFFHIVFTLWIDILSYIVITLCIYTVSVHRAFTSCS